MSFPLSSAGIREAFVEACHEELQALKPGNVHIHGAGHGMETHHFEAAAAAAAPWIADGSLRLGARVLGAVQASFAAANCNTNLGIVLLCAPLAIAAAQTPPARSLRDGVAEVLRGLDHQDATEVFCAIAFANPAGLGQVQRGDVSAAPTVSLNEAMRLASARDRIARAYVTDLEDIFTFGLPTLEAARKSAVSDLGAITALHMRFLATFPDSHIARKHGAEMAEYVRVEGNKRVNLSYPDDVTELLQFDRALKERGFNPGTTADFVVGTLYADKLIAQSAT